MRPVLLFPLLPALVYAAHIKRSRYPRQNGLLRDRANFFDPEHEEGEVLVKIINEPGSSQGQWLSLDGTTFSAFSTSSRPPSASVTAVNHANEGVDTGGVDGSKADQKGAQSYEQDKVSQATTTATATGTGTGTSENQDTAPAGGQGPVPMDQVQEWLKVHNEARRAHGAGELRWDNTLADGAKSNAMQCKGEHTAEKGENIASNSKGMSPQIAVNQWMGNAALYNGQFEEFTAHYTQMIWKSSQFVGCYLQECAPGTRYDAKYGTSWQATCRYDPAGNNVAGSAFTDNTQA